MLRKKKDLEKSTGTGPFRHKITTEYYREYNVLYHVTTNTNFYNICAYYLYTITIMIMSYIFLVLYTYTD